MQPHQRQGIARREVRPLSTYPTSALSDWQRDRLAVLLDALDGVAVSDAERRSFVWLASWEKHTVENVAAVIRRARAAGELAPACLWCGARPAPHVVLGDPRCECCYGDHRSEVTPGR